MKDTERRHYEALARVRQFCAEHAADFPADTMGAQLSATLNTHVNALNAHTTTQASSLHTAAQNSATRADARARLNADLEAISRTARAMDFDTPGLAERFRRPRDNRNDQTLLAAARAFAADALPLKAEFIRRAMPADFIETLQADINAFEQSVAGQNQSRAARIAATTAIKTAITEGAKIVSQLDAVVRNRYREDPATLAAWDSARHVERAGRPKTLTTEGTEEHGGKAGQKSEKE